MIITGLKMAFHAGKDLTIDHLLAAVPDVRPLSKADPKRVEAMTAWLEGHTKAAGFEVANNCSSA